MRDHRLTSAIGPLARSVLYVLGRFAILLPAVRIVIHDRNVIAVTPRAALGRYYC